MTSRFVRVLPLLSLLAACSAPTTSPSPSTEPSASPTTSTAPSPTASLPALACTDQSGGHIGSSAQLTDLRVAAQTGFDRLTFQFSAPDTPQFKLTRQDNPMFTKDASGMPVTLAGSAGFKVVFQNSSGVDASGHQTYTGSDDIKAGQHSIAEVEKLGDFERVLSWGVGLNSPRCVRVLELANPTRVVVDVDAS